MAVIGALIGSLAGAISFLFRALVASKDARIAALEREIVAQRGVMLGEINALKLERNLFRDALLERRRRATDA